MASIKKYYLKKSKDYRYEVYVSNGIDPGQSYKEKFIKKDLKVLKKLKNSQKSLRDK